MHRLGVALFGFALMSSLLLAPSARAIETIERGGVATMPPLGKHWVWVTDALFAHSVLFDADSGEMLATIDGGTSLSPKPPLFSPERGEFYSVEIDYARGRRGERTDYVTIYDAESLDVTGEVVVPIRAGESAASLAYTALLDGDRFLASFNQFPRTSVSIVDLEARHFVDEVVIAGCAGIYPSGERRFATLCGNGTVAEIQLDAAGRQTGIEASEPFFDAVDDPVMMAGGRVGERWVFVSYAGIAHEVDFGQSPPATTSWPLVSDAERSNGWRPGGRQLVALHAGSQGLYVIFHRGGAGSHKEPGPEVWVFDLAARERIGRFAIPNLTAAFLRGRLGFGQQGVVAWLLEKLLPDDGADTIAVSQDEAPLLFARNSERGAVAILDARTGEHLRDLAEVGLGGTRLEAVQ